MILHTLALVFFGSALAQDVPDLEIPQFNSQLFRPSIDSRSLLWTDETNGTRTGYWTARFLLNYANAPFIYSSPTVGTIDSLSNVLAADLLAGVTVGPVRIGADIPLYLLATGESVTGGAGLGDIALDVKGTLLDEDDDVPLGLALGLRAMLPTTTVDAPLGNGGLGYELAVLVDKRLNDLLLAVNLGTRGLPAAEIQDIEWNDQFFYRLGAGYALSDAYGVGADLAGSLNYGDPLSSPAHPMEALFSGWYRLNDDLVLRAGLGKGLTNGIGSPRARVVLSIGWEPPLDVDTDLDGLVDRLDPCPEQAEDVDNYEDADGCPDLDNDSDGIPDVDDGCPMEVEDIDQFQDEDGCPDPTTKVSFKLQDPDGSAIPGVAAQVSGTQVNFKSGTAFTKDLHPGDYQVVAEAEGFEGIDSSFSVPTAESTEVVLQMQPKVVLAEFSLSVTNPEGEPLAGVWSIDRSISMTYAGGGTETKLTPGKHEIIVSADGYGAMVHQVNARAGRQTHLAVVLQPAKVKVTKDKVEIMEKIFFYTGKSSIKKESFPLMNEIAATLRTNPEIKRVRIEGHTDKQGNDNANQILSERRAQSVMEYLVKAGIEAERLNSVGLGESKPLDEADTPEAYEINRRVEFVIEEYVEAEE